MIAMQVSQAPELLDILVAIAEIIGAFATAGAFWVTLKTLLEMKRQTDLANDPRLKIRFQYLDSISNPDTLDCPVLTEQYDSEPHNTWRRIITNNLEQDISDLKGQYLTLKLSNAGKSEITQIVFEMSLEVRMFENDVLGFEINPTDYTWPQELVVELSERKSVLLPVANVRYFPIYVCRMSNLTYKDVRGNQYTEFDGPGTTDQMRNEILRPRQPIQELAPEPPEPEGEEEPLEYEVVDEDEEKIPF